MRIFNIISGLFETISSNSRMSPRLVELRGVIDEVTGKNSVVDTIPEDINIIKSEIAKRERELRNHNELRPSDKSRCKSSEDIYNTRKVELESELSVLNILYKRVITYEVNNFPLNRACTIKYIADHIGVKESIIWCVLIIDDEVSSYLYCSDRYIMSIRRISDTKIDINVRPHDDYDYGLVYDKERKRTHDMILPNWRFVESTDSSIFYVERMS